MSKEYIKKEMIKKLSDWYKKSKKELEDFYKSNLKNIEKIK